MSLKATANIKEIIEEINKLRADPPEYTKKVEEYTHYFTGNVITLPNLNIKIQTQEGVAPYTETIEYLKTKEKAKVLVPSKALCGIAKEIAESVIDSETGEIDEEYHEKIIEKYGSFEGKFTRAMDFGGFTSEQVVINFLVCDGDPDRSQREPLLGDGLNKIGVAFGKHNVYSTICVLVTCTKFNNKDDPDDIMIFEENPTEEDQKVEEKQENSEQEKLEKERIEREKAEQEKERIEREKAEQEKEKERIEREKAEQEKEKERIEREKAEQEKERIEREKAEQEKERIEREKAEQAKLEKERAEKERLEQERLEQKRAEQERLEREKAEKEKLEKEVLEQHEKDKRALEEEKEKL